MEKNNDLPTGWEWAKISDISDVIRGASPRPKGDPRYFGGRIPWIMISDISKETGKFISKTRDFVTEDGSKKSRFLKKGSLILSNSGTVCVPKILAVDGCIHDGFVTFPELPSNMDILYAYFWFEYIRHRIVNENRQGITQVNLNTSIVKNIQIPIPPLNEQKRIIFKIEELFSKLDFFKSSVQKTQILVKQYRRLLLNSLLEREIIKNKTDNREINECQSRPLGELIIKIIDHRGITPKKLGSDWVNEGIPVISARNIKNYKLTRREEIRFITKDVSKKWMPEDIQQGDLLMTSEGATLGELALLKENTKFCLGQRLFGIRTNDEILDSTFLYYYLISPKGQQEIFSRATGTTVSGLRQTELMKLSILLPSIEQQKKIVIEIEKMLSWISNIENTLGVLSSYYSYVRKAILKTAFEGKLVPQDPNDEPASILLEKIQQNKFVSR